MAVGGFTSGLASLDSYGSIVDKISVFLYAFILTGNLYGCLFYILLITIYLIVNKITKRNGEFRSGR
jgi:hypothetical protein